jgi:hypothetical protein
MISTTTFSMPLAIRPHVFDHLRTLRQGQLVVVAGRDAKEVNESRHIL